MGILFAHWSQDLMGVLFAHWSQDLIGVLAGVLGHHCCSGRVSYLWFGFGFGNFSLNIPNFSIFFPLGWVKKYPSQRHICHLFTARVGSGTISNLRWLFRCGKMGLFLHFWVRLATRGLYLRHTWWFLTFLVILPRRESNPGCWDRIPLYHFPPWLPFVFVVWWCPRGKPHLPWMTGHRMTIMSFSPTCSIS